MTKNKMPTKIISILLAIMTMGLNGCGSSSSSNSSGPGTASIQSNAPLVTTIAQGGTAQGQVQALGFNYYIATAGVFPSANGGTNTTGAPYLGQIMIFAGDFAPAGWALCDGSLLNISSNTALFTLLGTTYGGDGVTTFGLP